MSGVTIAWLCIALVGAAPATVKTTEGKVLQGTVTELTAEQLIFQSSTGEVKLPVRSVSWVQLGTATFDNASKHSVTVELADGSRWGIGDLATDGIHFKLTLLDGETTRVPARNLKSVRFNTGNSALAEAWQQVLTTPAAGDLLVVRKANKEGSGVNLDPLEGTIQAISSDNVAFDFDGEKINVKRERLEGIVFFKPAKPAGSSVCRVKGAGNTSLNASRVELREDKLVVSTLSGAQFSLPLTSSLLLDFRAANEVKLAELEPDSTQSAFSLQPKGMKHDFSRIFGPRGGGPFGGNGLKLGKQTFETGLTLHSPTTVIYRVPEGSRKFAVTAGVADEAARSADMRLKVLADQRVVIEKVFNSESGRGPTELECDVTNVRRLTLTVETGAGLDVGDVIILGDARFVK